MNYEDMSDFDLDCKVAEIVFNGCTPYKDSSSGLCMVNLNKPMEDDICFNPCNIPADAWPIILENKISAMNDGDMWEASIDFDGDLGERGTDEVLTKYYEHTNPLRAAMIVYLMMQEQK